MTTLAGVNTYGYDALDRLVDVCFAAACPGAGDPFIRYAYDSVGNRTTETRPGGVTTSSYDPGDRLVSTSGPGGTTAYSFDANGNQTAAGARTFGYDLAGRMSSTTSGGATTSYAYDGDGVRLSASEGLVSRSFLWDLNFGLPQLALERVGGLTTRSYLHGAGPVSVESGGSSSYLHRDLLGSVTNVTSATGAALWSYAYEPFGAIRSQNDPTGANSLRFAGEYLDPSGLYHLRARQYDTTTGRFTATDPLRPLRSRPYVSSYVYADNRPTTLIDPSGMGAVDSSGCGIGVLCWLETNSRQIGISVVKVGFGCFAGGIAGEAAIASPVDLGIALLAGPEAAMLLPAAGCVIGAGVAAAEIGLGYEGPSLWP